VTEDNSAQVALMERHSREIVEEAKRHLSATFEGRSASLRDKCVATVAMLR